VAKRDEGHRIREESHAESAGSVSGPVVPQDLAMMAWFLAPERMETLRRQLIDGKAGDIEPRLWKLAYTEPFEQRQAARTIRYMNREQSMRGEADKPGPPYLNAPPGLEWGLNGKPGEDPIARIQGRHHVQKGARLKWDQVAVDVRRAARALMEDPEYREALVRRIADGKARTMRRLLWEWAERKSQEPADRQPRKPLSMVTEGLPWLNDPLAERERIMIEAQEAEAVLQALVREEARTKQVTAAAMPPDERSDDEGLELYEEPQLARRTAAPRGRD
jgi:hypothetical protein